MNSSKANGPSHAEVGAIETILHKIDRIEEGQGETIRRLDVLHTAIYEPDDGLFARIKAGDTAAEKRATELDQKYMILANQLMTAEKTVVQDAEKLKKFDESTARVDGLVKWQSNVNGVLIWLLVAVTLGTGGIFAKLLYDWLHGHVKVI